MAMFIVPAVALGIWAAFFLVGYAVVKIPCPFQRVAYYWTILATDVTAVVLAYLLLSHTVVMVLFSLALTKCLIWSIIMNHHSMVHAQIEIEK
jgi:hypothetical protein